VEITDAIRTLEYLFLGGQTPNCLDAADADDSGQIDITDAVYSLSYQFLGGEPPPPPGPTTCGLDPTPLEAPEILTCNIYAAACP
jgi:hypothetical protein